MGLGRASLPSRDLASAWCSGCRGNEEGGVELVMIQPLPEVGSGTQDRQEGGWAVQAIMGV